MQEKKQSDSESEPGFEYKQWLLSTFKYVLNNLEEFLFDQYANHIMRTAVRCITGETQLDDTSTSDLPIDEEFKVILKHFVDRLLEWPQFAGCYSRFFQYHVYQCDIHVYYSNVNTFQSCHFKIYRLDFFKSCWRHCLK